MVTKVIKTITENKMLEKNDKIIIGLSGGADSMTLLHLLSDISVEYCLQIFAVHINHNLRAEESDRDENFVVNVCNSKNIQLFKFKIDVFEFAKTKKISEEEAGRIKRYECFNEVLHIVNANKIAVAHNANDNAETVLINLSRGSGIKGLCGIHSVVKNIIRPLIGVTRKEIESYCLQNNIRYVIDSTNTEDDYTRNKIRHNIVSFIEKEINPSFINTCTRMTALLKEEDDYLNMETLKAFEKCTVSKSDLINTHSSTKKLINIEELKKNHAVIQRRVVRLACGTITSNLVNLTRTHVDDILNLIYKDTGKQVNISNNLIALKSYEFLKIYKNNISSQSFSSDVRLNEKIYIESLGQYITFSSEKMNLDLKNIYTTTLRCAKLICKLQIRSREIGDAIKNFGHTKKIKKYFIDNKLPKEERDSVPLLANGAEILLILGKNIIVSDDYAVTNDNEKDIIYIQIWEANNDRRY
jgi:tRNA(Ile)-lysidine synthase